MPTNPAWYYNLVADPTALVIQDGDTPADFVAREVFEVEMRRVLLGAAGVWRLTEIEVARGYFG